MGKYVYTHLINIHSHSFSLSISITLLHNYPLLLTFHPTSPFIKYHSFPHPFSFSIIKMDFLKPPFILVTAPLSIGSLTLWPEWMEAGGKVKKECQVLPEVLLQVWSSCIFSHHIHLHIFPWWLKSGITKMSPDNELIMETGPHLKINYGFYFEAEQHEQCGFS